MGSPRVRVKGEQKAERSRLLRRPTAEGEGGREESR